MEESESPEFRGLWVKSGFHGLKLGMRERECLRGLDLRMYRQFGVGGGLGAYLEGGGSGVSPEEEAPRVSMPPSSRTGALPLPLALQGTGHPVWPTPALQGPGVPSHIPPQQVKGRDAGGWGARLGNYVAKGLVDPRALQTLPCLENLRSLHPDFIPFQDSGVWAFLPLSTQASRPPGPPSHSGA